MATCEVINICVTASVWSVCVCCRVLLYCTCFIHFWPLVVRPALLCAVSKKSFEDLHGHPMQVLVGSSKTDPLLAFATRLAPTRSFGVAEK